MLVTDFEVEQEGITVPYPPLFDNIRRNYGFVDLRGRPDLASKIPEGAQSSALRELLVNLAELHSQFFTLGCDLGTHEEPESEEATRHVAGGYVQVMCASYSDRSPDDYRNLGWTIERMMDDESRGHNWLVRFVLKFVVLNLDSFSNLTPSLWIWFYAAAHTPEAALVSREALVGSLHNALTDERLLAFFEEGYEDKAQGL